MCPGAGNASQPAFVVCASSFSTPSRPVIHDMAEFSERCTDRRVDAHERGPRTPGRGRASVLGVIRGDPARCTLVQKSWTKRRNGRPLPPRKPAASSRVIGCICLVKDLCSNRVGGRFATLHIWGWMTPFSTGFVRRSARRTLACLAALAIKWRPITGGINALIETVVRRFRMDRSPGSQVSRTRRATDSGCSSTPVGQWRTGRAK